MIQIAFIILTTAVMLLILLLLLIKSGYQLQYLRLTKKQKPGSVWDFVKFKFSDVKARKQRVEAFLLFPMFYAIILDDKQQDRLELKRRVKYIHIAIYGMFIVLIVMGIFSEKIFPSNS